MKRTLTLFLFSFSACIAWGCAAKQSAPPTPAPGTTAAAPEIAPFMALLQRYSQKAGYSIAAKNDTLALFYLEEIEETLAEIYKVDEVEGTPIGQPAKIIMPELISALKKSVQQKQWKQSAANYSNLIDGCNRCHAATERQYVKILPATKSGPNPYNQDFSR